MSTITRFQRLGLTAKLIIPFLTIFILAIAILGTIFVRNQGAALSRSLEKKAEILVRNLATALSDPFSMGEYDQMQTILAAAQKFDEDVAYSIVVGIDGFGIASTDSSLRNQRLNRNEFEAGALNMSDFTRRDTPMRGVFEVLMPIRFQANQLGTLRVGISTRQVEAISKSTGWMTVAVGALALLVGVTIYIFVAQRVIRPIRKIAELAEKVARGDLTLQVESDLVSNRDEVGLLANAFSQMSAGLQGVIKRIQDATQQITSAADQTLGNTKKMSDGALLQAKAVEKTTSSIEQMNASMRNISENIDGVSSSALTTSSSLGEMSAAINQVAGSTTVLSTAVDETASALLQMSASIKQVADYIDTLSASAEETTTSITEMNASIKEVGKNAKESALLTEKVSKDAAELGLVAIEKTIEGMEKIKKTVDKSAYVINKLDERTEHIGKILTVIDDVTRQTNLLALNAAILAAQAGNEGKGFAVVADEIKSLADRTAASTKEIVQLIQDVQTEAKDAVISIKEGSQSVEEGVGLSINARQSLSKIVESSKQSLDMSLQIENATVEQVKATGQVTQLMEKVNSMVQQINSSMKELERGTHHITEASEKMKSMTRQVKASTEEQAKGSKQINSAVENITERIQKIAGAMNEQKEGHEVITKSILDIHRITQLSVQMVQQMNQAAEESINQATLLKGEVSHFKLKDGNAAI